MLKLALTHHGYSATSEQASTSSDSPSHNTVTSNSNDFPPVDRTPPVNQETSDIQEQENGMYL